MSRVSVVGVPSSAASYVADPAGAARAALDQLPPGPLAVHIDVDVLDFIDAPLAENTNCRNTGPTLDRAVAALQVATRDPRVRSLSIGEPDPVRRHPGGPSPLCRQHRPRPRRHGSLASPVTSTI